MSADATTARQGLPRARRNVRARSAARERRGGDYGRTTLLARMPMPSTSASMRSPARRKLPVAAPTPSGVPVAMMSPGQERHALREHLDALRDGEDHLGGVARLPRLPVHAERDGERLRVGDLVGRHEHGPHRAEGVERLALEPLPVALLEVARRHVVDDGVAEDVTEGLGAGNVAAARADHHRELDLVVQLLGDGVVDDVVAGADHRGAGLGEVHGVLGRGGAALGGVVGVVAAQTEDVARRAREWGRAGARA